MELPKFILGDNSAYPEAIYVIHTEFPRFIINLEDDEIEWLEDFEKGDEEELLSESRNCIAEASKFYDAEVVQYQE